MVSDITIHESVQAHYARAITAAGGNCCGDSCGCGSDTYDLQLIQELPAEVPSFGCGDPVAIASFKAGEVVLDLGSGAGFDAFLAARQVGDTGKIIGVDMTPAMLNQARANQERLGFTNVEFREGYIEKLPIEDNSIDVIISNCVINLSPDKAAVFKEAFRVLKPGGRVSVSDIVIEGDFSPALKADATAWATCVSGAIDVGEYTDFMRQAGFADIQVVDKANADNLLPHQTGMPRLFSARITAKKSAV